MSMSDARMRSLAIGKIMRNEFNYRFSSMEILRGYDVYASGDADISYRIERAEPDVGIMWRHIDIEILSIVLDATAPRAPSLNLSQDHPLYNLIVEALKTEDDVFRACVEDSENV